MDSQNPTAGAAGTRNQEDRQAVAAVLERIPEVLRVRQVRQPDGTLADFDPESVSRSIQAALAQAGSEDPAVLARLTYLALFRIDRQFGDGASVPSADDISRIAAVVLIDNNWPQAAKRLLGAGAASFSAPPRPGAGLRIRRLFVPEGTGPYDGIEWDLRDAVINDSQGQPVFEQRGVEVPKSWSQGATNIVASKYFRGKLGTPEREGSVRQMVERVAGTISRWGEDDGYFASAEDGQAFRDELTAILIGQRAAFNSPVWFNVGVQERPQCSACFINSVQDDLRSILNLTVTEGMLFKYGSGTGSNLSSLRSSRESLGNSSGKSSGPVSFMKGFDAFAGVIKSGGKTRRAAKMVILNADHPDIVDFVTCKIREEDKAKALIRAGYDRSLDGEAYGSVFFQNANNSVRVTDDFMRAVVEGRDWQTRSVTTGEVIETMPARGLMRRIAEATWQCGDPGLQFDTTVNRWNTVPNSGRINGSNPCSEYMFLDDSSCNLASLNLMRFRRDGGGFDIDGFSHAVDVIVAAQEILVGRSSYPTPAIEQNSHDFRPLGLGYANLGAILMSLGLAYDSDEGRNFAAALTALLSGRAYRQSSLLAQSAGPFAMYRLNERPFLKVIGQHRDAAQAIPPAGVPADLLAAARQSWDEALELGMRHGFRNAQISVLAPTGTIGFLMDCDTTGVEPDIALVKYKWLVGGGLMKIVNQTVPEALERLGYGEGERQAILEHLDRNDTIEGAPHLKDEHLPVFDCAFRPSNGRRFIAPVGHLKMMAAVQPFLSGAISKTVNMPNEATVEEIEGAYIEAWKMGIKAVAIYRDGSKGQQVLKTSAEEAKDAAEPAEDKPVRVETKIEYRPLRRRLPDERRSVTHKFSVAGHAGFITVGLYDDGRPREIFLRMSKGGSVVSGLMDAFAVSTSVALQYGVPLKVLVNKFAHVRFEPSGFTGNPNIRIAKSLVDYIFRWMALRFMAPEEQVACGINLEMVTLAEAGKSDVEVSRTEEADGRQDREEAEAAGDPASDVRQMNLTDAVAQRDGQAHGSDSLTAGFDLQADAPACETCGALMVRNGACYKCLNCGSTSGCS